MTLDTIGRDIMMLRPDYILVPAFKALGPYIVVVALLLALCVLEMQTHEFSYSNQIATGLSIVRLGVNFAVQVLAIIAMRSIGLFYRHYNCHLLW